MHAAVAATALCLCSARLEECREPPSLPYSWLLHVDMCLVSSLESCGWGWRACGY